MSFTRTDLRAEDRSIRGAVAAAKAGDMEALQFLYTRYADDVLGFVTSLVHDHHDAEDITQSVFAKLMSSILKYEQRDVPFRAWILRVSRNAALDHMRLRRATPCGEIRTIDEGYDQLHFERSEGLRQAMSALPDDQREVLVLRHISGLSPLEIAGLLGKTEGSIHGLHHRGRGTLRATLRELEVAPVTSAA